MKMKAVFLLTIFCNGIIYSNACSCLPQHPQETFCSSDFVILARVKRERIVNDMRVYKLRIRKEFKISEKGTLALKSGKISTSSDDGLCGVSLVPGKLYVLSGSIRSLKAHISMCDLNTEWSKVTKRQRKGYRALYSYGCSCDIHRCPGFKKCRRRPDSCSWRNSCETNEGICMRKPHKSCMWARTKKLTSCTREWRRNGTRSGGTHHHYNFL